MKRYLQKIGLVVSFTTETELSRSEFVERLSMIVDTRNTGFLNKYLELFSGGRKEFKGTVNVKGFRIRKKKKLLDTSLNTAFAQGSYREHNNKLEITTEINGFSGVMIPYYVVLVLIYSLLLTGIFRNNNGLDFPIALFFIVHSVFMIAGPYFMMQRSVKRMLYELEREFVYLEKR